MLQSPVQCLGCKKCEEHSNAQMLLPAHVARRCAYLWPRNRSQAGFFLLASNDFFFAFYTPKMETGVLLADVCQKKTQTVKFGLSVSVQFSTHLKKSHQYPAIWYFCKSPQTNDHFCTFPHVNANVPVRCFPSLHG